MELTDAIDVFVAAASQSGIYWVLLAENLENPEKAWKCIFPKNRKSASAIPEFPVMPFGSVMPKGHYWHLWVRLQTEPEFCQN